MRVLSLILAVALGAASVAHAQMAGALLPPDTRQGDRLTVTTATGSRVRGRLLRDAAGELTVRAGDREHAIGHTDIVRVDRHRNRVLIGPLVGLGGGLAAGWPLKMRLDNEGASENAWLALMVGLGVGVGTVADLFNGSTTVIYSRGPRPSTQVEPCPCGQVWGSG